MAKKETPEFYGGTPSGQGQKVPHGAGRAARLAAEGIPPAQTLADFQAAKNRDAFAASGSRGTDELVVEPPTLTSVVGHSAEKKKLLAGRDDAPVKKSTRKGS